MKLRSYWVALLAAAPLMLVTASASASAFPDTSTFTYNGYNVVDNTNVTINADSVNGTFGSGQIVLTGAGPNAGQVLPTWCLDVFYDLQGSGTFTLISPPFNDNGGDSSGTQISPATLAQIASLVRYGDQNVSVGVTSPAVQLAIWDVEYASFGYKFVSANPDVNSLAALLVGQANGTAGPGLPAFPTGYLKELVAVGSDGHQLNQGLVTATPIPGALLLFGSAIAAAGGAAWFNKRRQDEI
jgi:hypothetical protein